MVKNLFFGFTNYFPGVAKNKHEATIALLSSVARGADDLKAKLTAKAVPVDLVDEIVKLAKNMPEVETNHEVQKQASKPITEEQRNTLNNIYERIMDICKLLQVIYANNELKKSRYVFSKIAG